jgi:tripartite-type tricarboxylate transporter receptor subunit TctC
MKRLFVLVLIACLSLPLFANGNQDKSGSAAAASNGEWLPTQAIDLVVPYAAGGSSDLLGRAIEKVWPKYSPVAIRVVDKPGGGGVTGSVFVANSKPDGYTLCLAYGSGCDMSMPFLQKLEYDPFKALDPLVLISIHAVMVGVPANSEFKSMADMVTWSKSSGKPITVASSTANGTVDLVLQAFAKRSGVNLTIIPTNGTGESITMLIGGQTMAGGAHPSDVLPQYKAGRIRLVGVATDERDTAMPEVPTFKEQGINFSAYGSIKGVAVPKNTPDSIKKYYENVFKQICEDAEFIQIMKDMGQPVMYQDIPTFTKLFKTASDEYKQLIEDLGLAYYQTK